MTESPIQQIAADLRALGIHAGDVLLVHASLKALGSQADAPDTVIEGLLAALGPEGTLLMPALSYETITPGSGVFDVLRTCSEVGVIPEAFRTRPGTLRSLHPTHSVCGFGPLVEALLGEHAQDSTPCGPHSPFSLLPRYGGRILMLGCGLRPNTSMHAIEELVAPPYLFGETATYRMVDVANNRLSKTYRTHGFVGWEQRYDRVGELLQPPALQRGRVLAAEVFLIEAAALWDAALAALRQNPLYFVDRIVTATAPETSSSPP